MEHPSPSEEEATLSPYFTFPLLMFHILSTSGGARARRLSAYRTHAGAGSGTIPRILCVLYHHVETSSEVEIEYETASGK